MRPLRRTRLLSRQHSPDAVARTRKLRASAGVWRSKESTLPGYCRECDVRFVCNGECPKNRFIQTPTGEPGLNYLCAGYQAFFRHIDPAMRLMVAEIQAGRAAANVMTLLRGNRTAPPPNTRSGHAPTLPRRVGPADNTTAASSNRRQPRRPNDPCHCGSGRKFKKCCGREG
ncbi:MAG: SEC-C metal-binding domain-containing protein [Planctomycetaceae bacterium]